MDLPKVKYIVGYAFQWCEKLETINFPNAEIIGFFAFDGCD
jgi:hypothetical protein